MKTAIEWLYNELSKNNTSTDSVIERINKELSIWEQAKQMEKEQIIEAGNACGLKAIVYHQKLSEMSKDELIGEMVEDGMSHGEEYYNQTYKPETI